MTAEVLRRITDLIIRCLDPDEIVLFGSLAKGTADIHSDIDLIVIGPYRGPRHRRGLELRGLLDRYPLVIDLHVLTPSELESELARPFSWIATLAPTARRLYVRTPKKGKDPFTRSDGDHSKTQKPFYEAAFLFLDCSAASCEYHNFKFFRGEATVSDGERAVKTSLKKRSGE